MFSVNIFISFYSKDSFVGYNISDFIDSFSLSILKLILHCHLAPTNFIEKSSIFLSNVSCHSSFFQDILYFVVAVICLWIPRFLKIYVHSLLWIYWVFKLYMYGVFFYKFREIFIQYFTDTFMLLLFSD